MQADPSLLSLLERATNPLTTLNIKIEVRGLFAAPDQWRLTDEANPNIFSITFNCFDMQFIGKIQPRKLTEKELKEAEEQKNKKGGKKEVKQQEEDVQFKLELEKLSEQEQLYRVSEDQFRAYRIVFSQPKEEMVSEARLSKLLSLVESKSMPFTVLRKPDISEEEMAKLKKSKPKTLNLGELYPAQYRGRINLEKLSVPGQLKIQCRAQISFQGQLPPDCTKIQSQKCYAYISLTLNESINPLVEDVKIPFDKLVPQFPNCYKSKKNAVGKLKRDVQRSIRAISQQYTNLFAKDNQQDKKSMLSTLRINELNKRKETFLAEFIASGKYSIVKEKLAGSMKAILADKLRKEKCGGPILNLQGTLAQLNIFLQQYFSRIISSCADQLHQDLLFAHENICNQRKQQVAIIVNESKSERESRLAFEYETIHDYPKAQEKYLNLILLGDNLQKYAQFCMRTKQRDRAQVLYSQLAQSNPKYCVVNALFAMGRKEAITILQSLKEEDAVLGHQLLSLAHSLIGEESKGVKHTALAEKEYQMRKNPHLRRTTLASPYELPLPKVPKPDKYVSPLSHTQLQQIRLSLVETLSKYGFYNLVEKCMDSLEECLSKSKLQVAIYIYKEQYDAALQLVDKLLSKEGADRKKELLSIKGDICFKSEKLFESEEVFLQMLKFKCEDTYSIYLRLGLVYLKRLSWEDAKQIYAKATEIRGNSAVAWYGLGVANFNLALIAEAEEAFNMSSMFNPLSQEVYQHLKLIQKVQKETNEKKYKYFVQ